MFFKGNLVADLVIMMLNCRKKNICEHNTIIWEFLESTASPFSQYRKSLNHCYVPGINFEIVQLFAWDTVSLQKTSGTFIKVTFHWFKKMQLNYFKCLKCFLNVIEYYSHRLPVAVTLVLTIARLTCKLQTFEHARQPPLTDHFTF